MGVNRKSVVGLLHIIFFIILLLFSACEGESDSGTTGSIIFSIGLQSPKAEGLDRHASAINCTVTGISTVEGEVFDENNSSIATGGPWNCSAGSGVITGVQTGSNRRVVIRGRNTVGTVIYNGQITGVEVGEGMNNVGEITIYPPTVTTGNSPLGVVVTPNGLTVYVANWDNDTVSVIRTSDHTEVDTISVGDSPLGVAVTPDGSFVYVANAASDDVSVIQTSSNTVSTISLGVDTNPLRAVVTPDGNFVYVTNLHGDSVSVIKTSDNTVLTTIPVPTEPESLAVTPDGSKVYVNSPYDDTISVIDTSTNTVVPPAIPVGDAPLGIAVTPDGTNIYVANRLDDTVSVIRTSDNGLEATIPVGDYPFSVAVAPGGQYVYVTNQNDNTVSIIQTSTKTVIDTISVGNFPWCVTVSPSGNYIYVSNRDDNTLSVIAGTDDAYEENDTLATAYDLGIWEATWLSTIGGFGIQADDDWYRIDVTPGYERIQIFCQFTHADGDIDISLHDSSGNELASSTDTVDNESIDYTVSGSGTHYIRVYFGDQGNPYDLWWDDIMP